MTHRILTPLIVLALCALAGALAFFFLYIPYRSYQAEYAAIMSNYRVAADFERLESTANVLVYGTVASVDPDSNVFTMDTTGQNGSKRFTIRIFKNAFLARQTLHMNATGNYDAIAQEKLSSIADIHSGDRVAVLVANLFEGGFGTNYLVTGDAL